MNQFMMKIALDPNGDAQEISFDKVFTEKFMQKHTKYSDVIAFFKDVDVTNQTELEEISDETMNDYVAKTTDFKSWQKMLNTATTEYVINILH